MTPVFLAVLISLNTQGKAGLTEKESADKVSEVVQRRGLKRECFGIATEDACQKGDYCFAIRTGGGRCGSDPRVDPVSERYRVKSLGGEVFMWDPVTDEYAPAQATLQTGDSTCSVDYPYEWQKLPDSTSVESGPDLKTKLVLMKLPANEKFDEHFLTSMTTVLVKGGAKITYKKITKEWLVVSGTKDKGKTIYYSKVLPAEKYFCSIVITYPKAQKKNLDQVVARIQKSLR